MRLVLAALTAGLLFAGIPAVAAPHFAAPNPAQLGTAGLFVLVRGGCGVGFHQYRWRDRYGRWHVRCVPNR
ncbi:MAG: hypothetical protein ACREFK_05955 [Stellaceae bacterium]